MSHMFLDKNGEYVEIFPFANEKDIHQSSNKVGVSNYRQQREKNMP